MPKLSTTLAKLILAVSDCQSGEPVATESLRSALNALDKLNGSPAARAALLSVIADADRIGKPHIDGVPIAIFRCLVSVVEPVEVRHD